MNKIFFVCLFEYIDYFFGGFFFRFDQAGFAASVPENNTPGLYITKVNAHDLDEGPNARITYSFVQAQALDYFNLNPQTGVISARTTLDRESTPVLSFDVKAVDGGEEPRTGTAG